MTIIIIVIISKREVKAARAHMMPPQVHVYSELASPVNDVCRMYYNNKNNNNNITIYKAHNVRKKN